MDELKLQHIITLSSLLSQGAKNNFINITTAELSREIKKSQQAASKHILDLESYGYLERYKKGKSFRIKVTEKGYNELYSLFLSLKSSLESIPKTLDFEGIIVSGMGEGAYYMSLDGYKSQFKEKLGYYPYPGTLNIKLTDRIFINAKKDLLKLPNIFINGFNDNIRTFGWVKCYPATFSNENSPNCAVLLLERTHHTEDMLEIIAPISIKDSLSKRNGDQIQLKVILDII